MDNEVSRDQDEHSEPCHVMCFPSTYSKSLSNMLRIFALAAGQLIAARIPAFRFSFSVLISGTPDDISVIYKGAKLGSYS